MQGTDQSGDDASAHTIGTTKGRVGQWSDCGGDVVGRDLDRGRDDAVQWRIGREPVEDWIKGEREPAVRPINPSSSSSSNNTFCHAHAQRTRLQEQPCDVHNLANGCARSGVQAVLPPVGYHELPKLPSGRVVTRRRC
jgi:hypothetical protein